MKDNSAIYLNRRTLSGEPVRERRISGQIGGHIFDLSVRHWSKN